MSNIVDSIVVRQGNFDYANGIARAVNCDGIKPEGLYWRQPTSSKGVGTGWRYRVAQIGLAKPSLDSLLTIRVRTLQDEVLYIAMPDGSATTVFTNLCKVCCGTAQVMPAVTIPDPVIEENGCLIAGNYTYFSVTRALGAGEKYTLTASLNGVNLTPLAKTGQPQGFDTLAALQTWVNANWGPSTITLDGTKVSIVTATGIAGSIQVSVRNYFESNTPGALAGGQHYTANATLNGTAMTALVGAADAALSTIATAANADATWSSYGTWSVVAGKLRLVSDTTTTASIVVTIS